MSPSALWTLRDAQREVLEHATVRPAEDLPLARCAGRVCARDIVSPWPLPQAPVSIMDGYAAAATDLSAGDGATVTLRLVGESAAGRPGSEELGHGHAMRISTGAVLPGGADLVVPQEDCRVQAKQVTIDLKAYGEVTPGRWVRPRGCDVGEGEIVIAAGTRLGPGDLAAAAATGHVHLHVHRRPSAAILSTGDELVGLGTVPSPGQIVSTNALMLAPLIEAAGAEPVDRGICPDEPSTLARRLRDGFAQDVLITSGGASVGEHDLVAATLLELGCKKIFHGVALKPGKPVGLFVAPSKTLVFVLPGNPASTLVTFELLVRPVLRRMLGIQGPVLPRPIRVGLRTPARGAGPRTHFVRARLHDDGTASVLEDQRSGNLRSISNFDALIVVPAGESDLQPGTTADAIVIDPWWYERRSSS